MSNWTKNKPTAPGAYYVRGFRLGEKESRPALVEVVRDVKETGNLVCNLNKNNANDKTLDWLFVEEMADHFEWLGPLFTKPVADGMCNPENPASRCECREEFGHRVCSVTSAAADIDPQEGSPFHSSDDDLSALLSSAVGLLKVGANQDSAELFIRDLERVEGRLSSPTAADKLRDAVTALSQHLLLVDQSPIAIELVESVKRTLISTPPAAVVPDGYVIVPAELIEHVKHARKMLGGDPEPEYVRARLRQKLTDLLAAPTPPASEQQRAVVMPECAEQVAFVLRQIGSMDADEIDGDNVDLRFEDADGFDTGCDVSIVDYAARAASLLEDLLRQNQHQPMCKGV